MLVNVGCKPLGRRNLGYDPYTNNIRFGILLNQIIQKLLKYELLLYLGTINNNMSFNYYSHHSRSRLKKGRRRTYLTGFCKYNLRISHYSTSFPNNSKRYWDRIEGPTWSG